VTITATQGTISRQATVTVNPPWLSTFAISPSTLIGGDFGSGTTTGNATLNGPAPSSSPGYTVTFSSTNTGLVATPRAAVFPSTATIQNTTILTNPVTSPTSVVVTATDPTGITRSQTVTLQPAPITLSSLTLSATSVVGSNKVTGTVTLTDVAPSSGIDVELKTPDATLAYPGMFVHVPAGSRTATFTIATSRVGSNLTETISATHSATTKSVALSVLKPSGANNFPNNGSLGSQQKAQVVVTGGSSTTGSVNLSAPASGNITITLQSSNAVVSVPSSLSFKKGLQVQQFTVTTKSVTSPALSRITATGGGVTMVVGTVIVLPPNSVAIDNAGPNGGTILADGSFKQIGTVGLTGPAPTGGITVTIAGSRVGVVAIKGSTAQGGFSDNSTFIPAGSTIGPIYGQISQFTGINRGTSLTATYAGLTRSSNQSVDYVGCTNSSCGDLLVTAQAQANAKRYEPIRCASTSLPPCLTAAAAFETAPLAVGDTSGYYLYTPEMQLLAETVVTAASSKPVAYSYLWFAGLPVGSVETATSTTRWYATDHLGTPNVMTDAAGNPVWRAEYAPYGTLFNTRAGGSLHQPLRFPGQTSIDGSEPAYNVYRWYRSAWGRYTQADPIGLLGGTNLFTYATSNPIDFADPLGLRCCARRMYAQLIPKIWQSGSVSGAYIDVNICADVKNPDDCKFTQVARQLVDSRGGGVNKGSPTLLPDDPLNSSVTRSTGKICMKDSPGAPPQVVTFTNGAGVPLGPPSVQGLNPLDYPLDMVARFTTTVRDKRDANDALSINWRYSIRCQSPGKCSISGAIR